MDRSRNRARGSTALSNWYESFPADGVSPTLYMDFANNRYMANGASYSSLSAFDTSLGGSYIRTGNSTYIGSDGLVKTAGANVKRLNYDPITLQLKGILWEGSKTNVLMHSEDLSNVVWASVNDSVTANSTTSPDGNTTADLIIPNTSSGIHVRYQQYTTSSTASYAFSLFVKAGGYNYCGFTIHGGSTASEVGILVNLTDGTVIQGYGRGTVPNTLPSTYKVEALQNGWYRISIIQNFTSPTVINSHIWVAPNSSTACGATWAGDGTSGVYAWGGQLEVGSNLSSYIPTTSTAVTRAGETYNLTNVSWADTAVGTIVVKYRISNLSVAFYGVTLFLNGSNIIRTILNSNTVAITTGGVSQMNVNHGAPPSGSFNKLAVAYAENNSAVCKNGATVYTDTSVTIPPFSGFEIFGNGGPDGEITEILYYPTRVSNSELQRITT